MTADWRTVVRQAAGQLKEAGIEEPYADAEHLWCYISGTAREVWMAGRGQMGQRLGVEYAAAIKRRCRREPYHYITGFREFMGLDFVVDKRVLIPRPETEHLVERVLQDAPSGPLTVVDVGTGSGVIALSLAHFGSLQWQIIATDVSQPALDVAALNAHNLHVGTAVQFILSDLLTELALPADLVVANLPYVPASQNGRLAPELAYEPKLALYAPQEGLAELRRLAAQLPEKLSATGRVYLEIGQGQADAVEALLGAVGLEILPRTQDLAGIDRVVAAMRVR